MINLELTCAMCGEEKSVQLKMDSVSETTTLAEAVKEAGWISEQNGPNLDIYCSRKCAA